LGEKKVFFFSISLIGVSLAGNCRATVIATRKLYIVARSWGVFTTLHFS
jgi:hypothetical protein